MAAKTPYGCALCGVPCFVTALHSKPHAHNTRDGDPCSRHEAHLQQNAQTFKGHQKQSCVCGSCGVMYYCCEAHRRRHATLPGGHSSEECKRMAVQLRRAAELSEFPFPWFRSMNTVNHVPEQDRLQDSQDGVVTDPAGRRVLHSRGSGRRPPNPSGSQSASRLTCAPATDASLNTTLVTAAPPPPPPPPPPLPPQSLCSLLHSLHRQAAAGSSGAECSPGLPALEHPVPPFAHTGHCVDVPLPIIGGSGGSTLRAGGSMGIETSDQPHQPHQPHHHDGRNDDKCKFRSGYDKCGAPDQDPDDGLRCSAPGCWRRLCGCDGSRGRGSSQGGRDGDDGDWAMLQPPLLARVRLPGQSEPTAPGGESSLWDHAKWSRRVWHLPPHLTPPLRVPLVQQGGGKVEAPLLQAPPPPPIDLGLRAAQTDPRVAAPRSGGSAQQRAEQVQQQLHAASQSPRVGAGDDDGRDGLYGPCNIMDWSSYYRWAGLPVESPAALLLHFPLTLYGALRLVDERLRGALLCRGCRTVVPSAPKNTHRPERDEVAIGVSPEYPSDSGGTEGDAGLAQRAKRLRVDGLDPEVSPLLRRKPAAANVRATAATAATAATVDAGDDGDADHLPLAAAVARRQGEDLTEPPLEPMQQTQQLPDWQGRSGALLSRQQGQLEDQQRRLSAGEAGQPEGRAGDGQRWRVEVLYLGPQAELDQLDTFAVLLPLLPPGCTLRLHMVGPDVPDNLHGAVLVYDGDELGIVGQHLVAPLSPVQVGRRTETDGAGVATHHQDGAGCEAGAGSNAADAGSVSSWRTGLCGRGLAGSGSTGGPGGMCPRLEILLYSCMLHEVDGLLDGAELDEILRGGGGRSRSEGGEDHCFGGCSDSAVGGVGGGGSGGGLPLGSRAAVTGRAVEDSAVAVSGAAAAPPLGPSRPGRSGVAPPRPQQPVPLLVFAPNAGLPVYLSWLPSLELLLTRQSRSVCLMGRSENGGDVGGRDDLDPERPLAMPAVAACLFTAYNEEECVRSCQLLEKLFNLQPDVQNFVNPYRQPLLCVERVGNGLPSYSNGFLYGWFAAGVNL